MLGEEGSDLRLSRVFKSEESAQKVRKLKEAA